MSDSKGMGAWGSCSQVSKQASTVLAYVLLGQGLEPGGWVLQRVDPEHGSSLEVPADLGLERGDEWFAVPAREACNERPTSW